jgi:hypothetical protein
MNNLSFFQSLLFHKIAVRTFGLLAIIQTVIYGVYETKFLGYSQNPDPVNGRTIPYLVKSSVRYISESEYNIVKYTQIGGIFCLVGFTFFCARYLSLKKKNDFSI